MMNWLTLIVILSSSSWFLLYSWEAAAYEVRTHGEITRRAFETSDGIRSYLQAAGIRSNDPLARGMRTPAQLLAGFDTTGTPRDWMIEGVIREDDFQDHAFFVV